MSPHAQSQAAATAREVIPLSDVLSTRPLSVSEAAAVTIAVCDLVRAEPSRGLPEISGVRLQEHGAIAVEGLAAVPASRDAADYARLLHQLLPPRAPGPLRLAVARAFGGGELPPFGTPDEFFEIVRRFVDGEPRDTIASLWQEAHRRASAARVLRDISDVRRTRRSSRLTLARIADTTGLPVMILRQLEWGDFREWRNAHWAARAASEYARAAGMDPEQVTAIVEHERSRQVQPLGAVNSPAAREADAWPVAGTTSLASGARLTETDPIAPHPARRVVSGDLPLHSEGTVLRTSATRPRGFWRGAAAAAVLLAAAAASAAYWPRETWDTQRLSQLVGETGLAGLTWRASSPARQVEHGQVADAAQPAAAPSRPVSGRTAARAEVAVGTSSDRSPGGGATPPMRGDAPSRRPLTDSLAARTTPVPALPRAFSPSFGPADAGVFFHRNENAGSVLMKAQHDPASGRLQLLRIVDDGARNYHVRPSPDGSRIAFDSDRDGERAVYVAEADGSGVRRVSGPGYAAVPAWSPDGQRLAYVRGEAGRERVWNLWIHDLPSNAVARLTAYPYGQTWGGSWFPDGRRLAYSHEDRLVVADLETGVRRQFRSPVAGRLVRTPAVSPDGRYVAFQVHRDGGWLLDLRDGSMRRILADPTAEEFAWDPRGRHLAFHSRRTGTWSIWVMATTPS